jgi:L-fucono-1,5-lactonase
MIIDAHHHLWDPAQFEYPWMTGDVLAPIRRPFTAGDLWEVTDGKVAHTVLVQTISSEVETAAFLATARANDGLIKGVVGWVDLTAPDVAERIGALRAGPGGNRLVAIRHQVQDEQDPGWLTRPEVVRGLRAIGAAGLRYDLLVLVSQLETATAVVRELPEVTFVLDHLAKPAIAAGEWEPWASRIAELARQPNVSAKLSGLVTEASWTDWSAEHIAPYAKHAIDAFGPDRLMYGSDWPVCTLAASYEQVWELANTLVADLGPAERDAILGGTAARVYGI